MFISSRDNPKVKLYTLLRDKKSARARESLFVLEGERLIADAIKEHIPLKFAFYTADAAERWPEAVSALITVLDSEAYEVTEDVSSKLTGTVAPQGIYAVASRLDKTPPLDKIVYGEKYLVLNRLQDPGNVGTILRVADAVGISGVYLCASCDIYNPKLVRSTMGSLFRVPVCDSLSYQQTVELFKSSGVPLYASVVDRDAPSIAGFEFPKRCGVVIGNEGNGLSEDEAGLCDGSITIKMSGTIESLNAAAAAAIILWELTKDKNR